MATEYGLSDIGSIITAAVLGLGGSALGFRKVVKKWASEGVEIAKSDAERDIIESLRKEYTLMVEHNSSLIKEMQNLQTELIKLHQSVTELRVENAALKKEIDKLQQVIDKLEKKADKPTEST
jgi:septal ring factor EnvC (AmiA/AmiB activator)